MELFKNYVTGVIENSSKMEVFMHILTESIRLGDRILVFSQSLLTLDLIEDYLHRMTVPNRDEKWAKHRNYFRESIIFLKCNKKISKSKTCIFFLHFQVWMEALPD